MKFPRNAILSVDGRQWSDHGRSDLEISYEEIGNNERMIDGTLRKNVIARKRTLSVSWEMLPSKDSLTADQNAGAATIRRKYEVTPGVVTVTISYDHNGALATETMTMMFSSLSYSVVKRPPTHDLVNVDVELVEV